MKLCVFDIEGDSLNPTKIWCLTAAVFSQGEWRLKTTHNYNEMRKFFLNTDILVGHNITRWDIPNVERLLNIKVKAKVVDTLALSWYLYPTKVIHGLADWGTYFGVPKPPIEDWENLSLEEYKHRCEEDVKINCKLWDKQFSHLLKIYQDDKEVWRFIDYLSFKMDCAREAERSKWKLDVERCINVLSTLELAKEEKVKELIEAMPQVVKTKEMMKPDTLYKKGKTIKRPKNLHKSDGSLSSAGKKWESMVQHYLGYDVKPEEIIDIFVPSKELTAQGKKWVELLEENNLSEDYEGNIEYVWKVEEPKPTSPSQIKDWLFGLGWVPENFSFKRDSDGSTRQIPQIRVDDGDEKTLCPSVKDLFKVEPALELLEGLSVITHRIGILKGFLDNVDEDGYVQAQIQGLANTLRFKHKTIVNLPNVRKPYGKDIRGVLIAPEGYELCGSDMSSLEDRTKQHFMWGYDPEYVKEMLTDDFDPHLDLAVVAGFLTEEQAQLHKDGIKKFSSERSSAKTANYACVYGAGGAAVARGSGMTKEEGDALVEKYWERNWSVKELAKDITIKVFYKFGTKTTFELYKGQDLLPDPSDDFFTSKSKKAIVKDAEEMWLFNPVSKFWYSLRYPKDIFSTLNQGTGVFCFDVWIKNFRSKRPQLTGQMHDEVILTIEKGTRLEIEKLLKDSIKKTNRQLKLNRELDIDVQFGDNYAEIH